ncbi:conserved hypothetical protein [Trichinella spiralis]|uniref:hypothetical protein n=1 Tax=Trichinella spiralis TaxID=6334 RepID=UPI0001EFE602|nr:conserved hypothetical protein [Trichinella spiralis]
MDAASFGPQQISIDVITPDILVIDSEDVDFNTNGHQPLTTTPQVATSLEGSWLKSEIFSSQQPSTTCNSEYIMFCVMISILSILVASTFFILYLYMRKSCAERTNEADRLNRAESLSFALVNLARFQMIMQSTTTGAQ